MVSVAGGSCSRADTEGARCCHLGCGEGCHWPTNARPAGGLGRALLGGWAKPATHSCGGLAAGGGGCFTTPPILTTHPCTPVPFNACGQPLAGLGCCCSLAAHGCLNSHPMPCWVAPAGELAKWPEVLKLRWPGAGGGGGQGGVAGAPPRPYQPGLEIALRASTLPPPQSSLPGRGQHPAPGLGC